MIAAYFATWVGRKEGRLEGKSKYQYNVDLKSLTTGLSSTQTTERVF